MSSPTHSYAQSPSAAPGLRARLQGYVRSNWTRDPYTFGSYSYAAAGESVKDREALQAPVEGRIFFAGEAVHSKYNSTVHAAHVSGLEAAQAVKDTGARRVAVVGAGMSGLTTAHGLSTAGVEVTVFEARDRMGGRLWTDDSLGIPLDLGASWIHGANDEGHPLTKLSNELGLVRVKTGRERIMLGGSASGPIERAWQTASNMLRLAEIEVGAGIRQLNPWAYIRQYKNDFKGDDVLFPQGYSQILKALEGEYELRLSTPVQRIASDPAGVRLSFDSSDDESFDAVVVSVPLGVLKRDKLEFDPPLPEAKRAAIQKIGMGNVEKLYLLFDEPFWDRDPSVIVVLDNGLPDGQFQLWINFYKYLGAPVLLGFNGGSSARHIADLSDEQVLNRAMSSLQVAYPGAAA